MSDKTSRDRVVGHWLLAGLFTLAGIAAAMRAWRLIGADGVDGRSLLWVLALLGFVSLAWRSYRAARAASAPPV
ncbi:MAG: hypothetical protein ACRELD_13765 [Longimicrobiales bacterium]